MHFLSALQLGYGGNELVLLPLQKVLCKWGAFYRCKIIDIELIADVAIFFELFGGAVAFTCKFVKPFVFFVVSLASFLLLCACQFVAQRRETLFVNIPEELF